MSENVSILKVQDTLPCGCVLTMSIKQDGINKEHRERALLHGAGILAYWLTIREETHTCALVTEDNPTGRDPKKVILQKARLAEGKDNGHEPG